MKIGSLIRRLHYALDNCKWVLTIGNGWMYSMILSSIQWMISIECGQTKMVWFKKKMKNKQTHHRFDAMEQHENDGEMINDVYFVNDV